MSAIEFENISKQYRLGLISTRTLSHDLNRWWKMNIQRKEDPYLKIGEVNDRAHKGTSEYVWALKDINFKVDQGDVLGIIGKNGAGKSTLLKILSKVTSPTTGTIRAKGRIASLLEVGTGFHPEMTGRENIYMNGSIMGMTKAEITRKFDEIIDFSGIERYVDTPVKRYSSGMTVRLGFAIAAHLEPEILVVDEVLAVGDAEFQNKAIGKMQDVSKGEGRTVLFVSHNLASMQRLCNNGILLQNGAIEFSGNINDTINAYICHKTSSLHSYLLNDSKNKPHFKAINVMQGDNNSGVYDIDKQIEFNIEYNYLEWKNLFITIVILTKNGQIVYHSSDEFGSHWDEKSKNSRKCIIPKYGLNTGKYSCTFAISERNVATYEKLEDIISFEVRFSGVTAEYNSENSWRGLTGPGLLEWE